MTVVGGFPFILPDNKSLLVFMPWYSEVDDTVYWQGIADSYQTMPDGEPRPFEGILAMWAWINKLNPDWSKITEGTYFDFGTHTGTTQFPLKDVNEINVEITQGEEFVDRWWGSAQIGKYAVVNFINNGVDSMPLSFINTQNSSVVTEELGHTGFAVTFMPGVYGKITARSRSDNGNNSSLVPSIYYIADGGSIRYGGWGTKQLEPSGIDNLAGTP